MKSAHSLIQRKHQTINQSIKMFFERKEKKRKDSVSYKESLVVHV